MTKADGIVIGGFESKLNRLMDAYVQLLAENAALREQLTQQSVELGEMREQYKSLSESYSNLKLTRIISASDSDIGATKQRLFKLVREVDRCIVLLNASEQKENMS